MLLLVFISCESFAASRDKFTLQLRWEHQAQFLGYYVADALGYYQDNDLDVEILPGGMGISPLTALDKGIADAAIEWLPSILNASALDIKPVNVSQILQSSGLMLICHRNRNIHEPKDLLGKKIGSWFDGSDISILFWLRSLGVTATQGELKIHFLPQGDAYKDWEAGDKDCISAMSYNEYWALLEQGIKISDTSIFRLKEYGQGVLEDGIYVDSMRLKDPHFVERMLRFLQASLKGWRFAVANPTESVEILLQQFPGLDRQHQVKMTEEVIRLVDVEHVPIGLMLIDSYDRTLHTLQLSGQTSSSLIKNPENSWTHRYWELINPQSKAHFSIRLTYRLNEILSSKSFYYLTLCGVAFFAFSGFARAKQREYDIWGATVLASLPAIGGTTLRDVLVGGDRSPPAVFHDPSYIYVILAVVMLGSIWELLRRDTRSLIERYPKVFLTADTIGLSVGCIIGAKVAIISQLHWIWIPLLGALSVSGGGIIMDVVLGKEPQSFKGELYEEIAILGGLFLYGALYLCNYLERAETMIFVSIAATLVLVFTARIWAVRHNLQSFRLSMAKAPKSGHQNAGSREEWQ